MYPQGNSPDPWPQDNQQNYQQYHQQPDPYVAYGQPPPPYQPTPYPQTPYQPPRRSGGRTPLIIIGAVLGVLVLTCAAGFLLIGLGEAVDDGARSDTAASASARPSASSPAASPTPRPSGTGSPTEESIEGDLAEFRIGDCLTITGSENTVKAAKCADTGAFKVLLRRDATTDTKVCDGTEATDFLYQDYAGTGRDLVLCVAPAKA